MVDVDQKTNKQKKNISVKCQEIWLRDELRASSYFRDSDFQNESVTDVRCLMQDFVTYFMLH